MISKVVNLLQSKAITISRFLLENYKNLNLSDSEFIILIYLLNNDNTMYDPTKMSKDLNIDLPVILSLTDSLKSKDIIKFETRKTNNKIEEHISFDELYKKLGLLLVNEKEEKTTNIFDIFESEFGRTLSSIEYEIINAWLSSGGFTEELIIAALKEAVYNGVSNLRYIDKILYEWRKKGIKTKEDIEINRQNYIKSKEKVEELYDYDWLNEEK